MKGLILKDLYNIAHNARAMALTLVFLAVFYGTFSSAEIIIVCCCVMCSMMTITTFTFDHASQWTRYALVMPVSKRDLVAGKFVALFLFTLAGMAAGLALTLVSGLLFRRLDLSADGLLTLFLVTLAGFSAAQVFGGLAIPLIFRFGSEQARILLLAALVLPSLALLGLYRLLTALGVVFTGPLILGLLCAAPFAALAFDYAMYRLSCRIFEGMEP